MGSPLSKSVDHDHLLFMLIYIVLQKGCAWLKRDELVDVTMLVEPLMTRSEPECLLPFSRVKQASLSNLRDLKFMTSPRHASAWIIVSSEQTAIICSILAEKRYRCANRLSSPRKALRSIFNNERACTLWLYMLYRLLVGTLFLELALRLQVSSTTQALTNGQWPRPTATLAKEQIIRWKTMAPPPTIWRISQWRRHRQPSLCHVSRPVEYGRLPSKPCLLGLTACRRDVRRQRRRWKAIEEHRSMSHQPSFNRVPSIISDHRRS
jgi:hypothetical protein